jgi:hypothetical protein
MLAEPAMQRGRMPPPGAASDDELHLDVLRDRLTDRSWRLSNLYKVRNDEAETVTFKPFRTQQHLIDNLRRKNNVLKGRQMRVTTGYCALWLDAALFNTDGLQIGIIAHTKGDASKIFKNKICFPYDNLPEEMKTGKMAVVKRTESEIGFANGANISVGVSFRSGNLQVLHVTEYGYICARQPLRAEEIRTGAFIAAQRGITVIESTAMGQGGHFAELCRESRKGPSHSQWTFQFLPWYMEPTYAVTDLSGPFHERKDEEADYLNKLQASAKIILTPGQRRWWCLQRREFGDLMFREFPSTPEEAFKASTEGAYYGQQMLSAWQQGRITDVPVDPYLPLETWWDIGYGDKTSIWFVQRQGMTVRVVDFYENSGEGVEHYANYVKEWAKKYGIRSIRNVGPHDLAQGRWSTGKTQLQSAADHGLMFEVVDMISVSDGIEAVRRALPMCVFDEGRCSEGIMLLERYRKKWNDALSVWSEQPLHDDASHAADAFRTGVLGMQMTPIIAGASHTPRSPAREVVPVRWR